VAGLDERKKLPLYCQLKDILYDKIMTGEWEVDSKIPTEEELVVKYEVSRSTVRSAISELTREGMLRRKRGVGTFVTAIQMNPFTTIEERGDTHDILMIVSREAGKELASILQINPSEPVFDFLRLRHIGIEKVIERSYIKASLCPGLPLEPPSGIFYKWLADKYGLHVENFETLIEAGIFDEEEGELVGVERGAPALIYKRTLKDARGVPFSCSTSLYRGDRFCVSGSFRISGLVIKIKDVQS
jgi:GntR family transcriptional regulator